MIRYLYVYIAIWFTTLITGNAIQIILHAAPCWLRFYQTKSAWSMGQGLTKSIAAAYSIEPADTIFHMWEELTLAHDTKCNRRGKFGTWEFFLSCWCHKSGVRYHSYRVDRDWSPPYKHHFLIARFMGPTWGLFGADRTYVSPMWDTWTLPSRMP